MRLDHLVRLICQPWAIQPDVLESWCQILDAKLAGTAIPPELAASGGRRSTAERDEPFTRDGNLAIVPVVGTMVKANTLFSCDATYGDLRQAVAAAERAKGIDAILLDADTPGGTVAGVHETGDFLARTAQRKPVYGWVDDLVASAGYWLMSQTRMIGAHPAADIGSIGVITVHYDRSGRDANYGVKRTVLAVGEYKAAGNDTGPLSAEAHSYIMERLNQTYDLFISAVTRGRPQLAADTVRATQSRVYKADQARNLGLIDRVMGRDEYIDLIKRQTRGAVAVPVKGAKAMTLEDLRTQHPELVSRIEASAREGMITRADHESAVNAARAESSAATKTSVIALHAAVFGEDANKRFSAIVESGVTAEQATALGVTATTGEDADKSAILSALHAVAPAGLKPGQIAQPKTTTIDTAAIYSARQPR